MNRFSVLRFFVLLFFVFSGLGEVKGQNIYNTYQNFDEKEPIRDFLKDPYTGEYEMNLQLAPENDGVHWLKDVFSLHGGTGQFDYFLSYKIEVVSFPFMPNVERTTDLENTANDRILTTIKDAYYQDLIKKEGTVDEEIVTKDGTWVNNDDWWDNFKNHTVWRKYDSRIRWPYVEENNLTFNSRHSIASLFFKNELGNPLGGVTIENSYTRAVFPHTVLKHHIYLHCGTGMDNEKIDSISFVIDLTRGKLREYPFYPSNFEEVGSNATYHDLSIIPTIELGDNFDENSAPQNQFNYFPNSDMIGFEPISCPSINPFYQDAADFFHPYAGEEIDFSPDPPIYYIHPAPFSLVGFYLQGAENKYPAGYEFNLNTGELAPLSGIKHTYIIDENIDLTKFNPEEKIIYNPSTVHIEADDLVFPSGYTFKTVRGLHPTQSDVDNATTCDDRTGVDERLIHVPTDLPNENYIDALGNSVEGKPSNYIL